MKRILQKEKATVCQQDAMVNTTASLFPQSIWENCHVTGATGKDAHGWNQSPVFCNWQDEIRKKVNWSIKQLVISRWGLMTGWTGWWTQPKRTIWLTLRPWESTTCLLTRPTCTKMFLVYKIRNVAGISTASTNGHQIWSWNATIYWNSIRDGV